MKGKRWHPKLKRNKNTKMIKTRFNPKRSTFKKANYLIKIRSGSKTKIEKRWIRQNLRL